MIFCVNSNREDDLSASTSTQSVLYKHISHRVIFYTSGDIRYSASAHVGTLHGSVWGKNRCSIKKYGGKGVKLKCEIPITYLLCGYGIANEPITFKSLNYGLSNDTLFYLSILYVRIMS